ncbi:MAG: peptidylprolyl isomerase [Sedimentisphaerales bacterium]|nr:peptidylprolyl isomerase [Sedimentisphaerales bacterium]
MNTRLFRALTLIALFCAVLNLSSCKRKETAGPEANKPAPAKTDTETLKIDVPPVEPVTATTADKVLVTVNSVNITQKQLDDLLKPHLERLAKQAANLPPGFIEQQKNLFMQQALQEMIRMQLLNEQVKLANIVISDQDVTDEIMRVASQQKPPATMEEFMKKMEEYGYDIDQLKDQIRTVLGQQKLMAKEFPADATFTEDDAKAYYEANKTKYEVPEHVRASHILVKTDFSDPNSDPNQIKATAKAKADSLLKQVNAGGDFAALAKTNSDCPSAPRGGDLDFFPRGQMVPAFDKVAFETEVGKVSGIVETQFGYHIIKVTDRKEAATTSFEDAKAGIIAEQSQRKLRDLATKYIEKLKADAKIVYAPGMEPKPATPSLAPGAPGGTGAAPK